jgi:hypothetical protein
MSLGDFISLLCGGIWNINRNSFIAYLSQRSRPFIVKILMTSQITQKDYFVNISDHVASNNMVIGFGISHPVERRAMGLVGWGSIPGATRFCEK